MTAESAHPTRPGLYSILTKAAPTLLVLAIMAAGWLAIHEIDTGGEFATQEEVIAEPRTDADMLTLPEGKLKLGKFETTPAQIRQVQHAHTIPGRIRYDETKHVDVKAPMGGILAEVLVTPGEQVTGGQFMAVLRSPEIGRARAEILKQQKECDIAGRELERALEISKNLQYLSSMLDQGQPADVIARMFVDRPLGGYRQDILSAYAKLRLASELLAKVRPLASSGSVSGRMIREREAARQLAETAFRTARDQATFSASQAKLQAEADAAQAKRQCDLAWQAVDTMLGYTQERETTDFSTKDALSRLEIRAPFSGTIEFCGFATGERVSRGDSLFVLANTKSLYVAASIRESDWAAGTLERGTLVSVVVPALDDRVFEARVRYFGREVDPETNSVPLVATIDNREGLLRPGMFVRVTVPIGTAREALSVRAESVVQHEDQEFVFVDLNGGTFKRVDVATGQTMGDWIEVTEGLSLGQSVVSRGAFLLKSELLLQGEGD